MNPTFPPSVTAPPPTSPGQSLVCCGGLPGEAGAERAAALLHLLGALLTEPPNTEEEVGAHQRSNLDSHLDPIPKGGAETSAFEGDGGSGREGEESRSCFCWFDRKGGCETWRW